MTREETIEAMAVAMAGAEDWRSMGEEIRRGWRELARRAATALPPIHFDDTQIVDDHVLTIRAGVILAKHAGRLTTRSADSSTREAIARAWIASLHEVGHVVVSTRPPRGDFSGIASGSRPREP